MDNKQIYMADSSCRYEEKAKKENGEGWGCGAPPEGGQGRPLGGGCSEAETGTKLGSLCCRGGEE